MDGKIFTVGPDVQVHESGDQLVLVNPANLEWIKLTADAYRLADNPRGLTVSTLVAQECSRCGANADELRALLRYLVSAGFLMEREAAARPARVYLNVTDRCNLSCPACYFAAGSLHAVDPLSTEVVLEMIDALAAARPRSLVVSGGEPFVRRDICDILLHVTGKFDDVILLSNGCLIGEREAEWVLHSGARVQVSIESGDAVRHEAARGRGTFDAAVRGIRALLTAGVERIEIVPTVTRSNLADLPGVVRLARALGVGHHFSLFMPVGRGACHAADLSIAPRDLLRCLASLIMEDAEAPGGHGEAQGRCPPIDLCTKTGCGAGHEVLSVGPDGSVYPCPLMHRPDMCLGALPADHLSKVRRLGKNAVPGVARLPSCFGCDVAHFCGGGCRANALAQGGSVFSPDPYCEFYKRAFGAALWGWRDDRTIGENCRAVASALVDGL